MICPLCHRHKLLHAEGRWYCPQCYQVYTRLPIYGSELYKTNTPLANLLFE